MAGETMQRELEMLKNNSDKFLVFFKAIKNQIKYLIRITITWTEL